MNPPDQTPGTTEQQVRQLWSALFDERNFAKVRERWSATSVDHFLALGISARGPAELEAFFRTLFDALPDLRMTIENVVADDATHHAVVQWHASGTTSGKPFQGIEPLPRRHVELRGCDVFRLDADGRLIENTIYYDGAEFARGIGMLPPRGSALDRSTLYAFNAVSRLRARLTRQAHLPAETESPPPAGLH